MLRWHSCAQLGLKNRFCCHDAAAMLEAMAESGANKSIGGVEYVVGGYILWCVVPRSIMEWGMDHYCMYYSTKKGDIRKATAATRLRSENLQYCI
jgi:hypothetical protein